MRPGEHSVWQIKGSKRQIISDGICCLLFFFVTYFRDTGDDRDYYNFDMGGIKMPTKT